MYAMYLINIHYQKNVYNVIKNISTTSQSVYPFRTLPSNSAARLAVLTLDVVAAALLDMSSGGHSPSLQTHAEVILLENSQSH